MNFEFATASRIIFGPGSLGHSGALAGKMGRHAFVITGKARQRCQRLLGLLDAHGVVYSCFSVAEEPTVDLVAQAVEQARTAGCDMVIGMGGGSVLDTAKAVAALLANGGQVTDYLEVIGLGRPVEVPSVANIAIPTTAGTGTEVTRNAVIDSPDHRVKVSMRSSFMLPHVAIVDPELTVDLPPDITAYSGMDALTQLVEAYVSNSANAMTDAICREGLKRAARSLENAYTDGSCLEARTDMALAALFSGMALANAKLGAVHGLAGTLGGMYAAPHGAICARLLPLVMTMNMQAIIQRDQSSRAMQRYDEVGRILTGNAGAGAAQGNRWVRRHCQRFRIPGLQAFGAKQGEFEQVVDQAMKSSSMKGNPVRLTEDELAEVLTQAF